MAVATLDEALNNLVAGVTGKGKKYDKKHDNMVSHFKSGLARLGITVGSVTGKLYEDNTRGKGDKLEKNAIAGAKAKWKDNYKAGLEV
jgi:hypothetical protein